MQRYMCKSKIHRATVTDAQLNYIGSIMIDATLMKAADLLPYERVDVLNLHNGARLTTYVIEGVSDSGCVVLNGAASRHVQVGDLVIIVSYGLYDATALQHFEPAHIYVDAHNRLLTEAEGDVS